MRPPNSGESLHERDGSKTHIVSWTRGGRCSAGWEPKHSPRKQARGSQSASCSGRYKEALAALADLPDGDPIVERLAGYAIVQSRGPLARAKPHFEASLAAARAGKRPYEVALTLRALAETTKEPYGEAEEILDLLGVVSTPRVPLP